MPVIVWACYLKTGAGPRHTNSEDYRTKDVSKTTPLVAHADGGRQVGGVEKLTCLTIMELWVQDGPSLW